MKAGRRNDKSSGAKANLPPASAAPALPLPKAARSSEATASAPPPHIDLSVGVPVKGKAPAVSKPPKKSVAPLAATAVPPPVKAKPPFAKALSAAKPVEPSVVPAAPVPAAVKAAPPAAPLAMAPVAAPVVEKAPAVPATDAPRPVQAPPAAIPAPAATALPATVALPATIPLPWPVPFSGHPFGAQAFYAGAEQAGGRFKAAAANLLDLHSKFLSLASTQSEASLSALESLLSARSLSEAIEAQSRGIGRTFETVTAQWQELAHSAQRLMGASAIGMPSPSKPER